jgi:DNA topoisomerase I
MARSATNLVIVESPSKAKTINKYLGKEFVVTSSKGHIRDLPSGDSVSEEPEAAAAPARGRPAQATPAQKAVRAKAALVRRMGVDPEHGWAARYEISGDKLATVQQLREAAAKADAIWLASDLDREGEAIAWHLMEVIGGDPGKFRRVVFNEITKTAIAEAFARPGQINQHRVDAQQARRFLDRVVGFMVSPLLWQKVARGLSAGRVQSVAVRLIVEREREIRAFIPDEFWEVDAEFGAASGTVRAQVVRRAGAAFRPTAGAAAEAAAEVVRAGPCTVAEVETKAQKSSPSAPFITSTLQAAASLRLGFSVKKTMTLAQRLYEAGHITYMRTDSTNLSADAVTAVRAYIGTAFGARYVPAEAKAYASKSGAQEAHEAIRPSDVGLQSRDLQMDADEVRLYDLIWRQFVACQMPPAEFDSTGIVIRAGDCELSARGRVLRFDGFQKVLPPMKQEDAVLPAVRQGEVLRPVAVAATQHFTKPPGRYSEAGLVKELEKRGIGRPSTYASIISTIQDRGYVRVDGRRFFAEKLGDIVTSRLAEAFPDLMDYGFTAGLEGELDRIAQGGERFTAVLDRFYGGFTEKLEVASDRMRPNPPVEIAGIACPTCGRPMAVRTARTGVFLSCTGYNLPAKERCTATMPLVRGAEAEAVVGDAPGDDDAEATEAEALAQRSHRRCDRCGTAMDAWLVDAGRRLHICGNNPECPGTAVETGQFKVKGYDGPSIPCDKCGKPMQLKVGRFGKYFGCTGYPTCANTRKLLRSGQAAPPKEKPVPMPELACTKGGHFVLRDGMLGLFLASNLYPKVRETRAPLVSELAAHRGELAEKFRYLADAPAADPQGRPVAVRFSRASREHYLAALDAAGETADWSAFWTDGRWVPKAADPLEAKPRRGRPPKARA